MYLPPPKELIDKEFTAWIAATRPATEAQSLRLFRAGFMAGVHLALKILKEGVNDPYDWKTP